MALGMNTCKQAVSGRIQLWRVIGAVEIGYLVGYVKEGALAWNVGHSKTLQRVEKVIKIKVKEVIRTNSHDVINDNAHRQ
jgi:hypothetical protein